MSFEIEAVGLAKRFGGTVAVEDVDLSARGGVVGLLGPNGAGKTTLLRMLATVLVPDAGSIRLCGLDPASTAGRLAVRRQLGYLPQEPGLYQGFTAFDLVDYVAVLKEITDVRARRAEVRRVLELLDLGAVAHRKIRALSGGTRHRVALAASMLGEPSLLLLDEPAAGLDPEHRLQLRSILSEAGSRGTVVVSTHHTGEAAALCRRVVVVMAGRVRFNGTPAELAAEASGRVWEDDTPVNLERPGRLQAWLTAEGRVRNVGDPPAGADVVEPTIDDGYLLLTSAAGVTGGDRR